MKVVYTRVVSAIASGLTATFVAFSCSNPSPPALPQSVNDQSGDGNQTQNTGCPGSQNQASSSETSGGSSSLLDSESSGSSSSPTYYGNIQPILKQSCTLGGCHAAGAQAPTPDLSSYQLVINNKDDVIADVTSKTMPQGGSLTAAQIQLFSDWKAAAYPEGTAPSGSSSGGSSTGSSSSSSTSSSSSSNSNCKANKSSTSTSSTETSGSGASGSGASGSGASGSGEASGTGSDTVSGSGTGTGSATNH